MLIFIWIPLIVFVNFNYFRAKPVLVYYLTVKFINLIIYPNVGFYDNGNVIIQREEVTKNYLNNIIITNLLTTAIFMISFNY